MKNFFQRNANRGLMLALFFLLLSPAFAFGQESQQGTRNVWVNLQWPQSGTIDQGASFTVYAQIWVDGITNQPGPGAGIQAWIGLSQQNTHPETWTTWVPASYNVDAGNNDEYLADIGPSANEAGTWYYASRLEYNGQNYYGGVAGFWNAETSGSGVLTVNNGGPAQIAWANLQWPGSGEMYLGQDFYAYAQAYIPGITSVEGQTEGLQAWLGLSNENTDPATWDLWVPADFYTDSENNDEFRANIGQAAPQTGTWYYASRFSYLEGESVYGGFSLNPGGWSEGGFWDGDNYVSGVLQVNEFVVECGDQVAVVTSQPAFPLEDAAVTIYFNAALGNGGLLGYEGDIYAHTGVITSESTGPSDWRYVIADWGVNTPQGLLEAMGNNVYKLEIPNLRSFYGVPAAEQILQIALVFRSDLPIAGEQFLEGKNADGSDIYVDVYEPGLAAKILNPSRRDPLVGNVPYLAVCVEAMDNDLLEVYLNDELLLSEATQSITYGIEVAGLTPGTHYVIAHASAGTQVKKDSVAIFVRPAVEVAALPAGVVNGINYIDPSTVTLVLHDPPGLKSFVFAIGDYSDWMPNEHNYMKRTPDGKHFWLTLTDLTPGNEYAFQYYIDGEMRLADPYAEKILDPWNDRWISTTTYPNLKTYPYDKTTGIVSIIQPNRPAYTWQVPEFTPPAVNATQSDLFVYELLIRDFVESRDIKDVMDKLDYLQELGVNAVQLMPIMEFDGNESWGYAPNFFFATDKYYGNRHDYKAFIDACHQRGMAVILDVVPNHAFGQSPMVNMYFDPHAGEFGQPLPQNPWFNQQAPHPFSVGYDFNHESPYVREFFKRVFEYWLTEFKVDGFRIDLSKGLTQNFSGQDMGAWSAYDQSRINILFDYYNHIKSVNPNAYVILEHFANNDEEVVLANGGMLMWSAMHDNYKQVNIGYINNSSLAWAYHATRGFSYPNLIDYMENHDEERLTFEALAYGNASGSYNIKDTLTALERMEMTSVLFFGIPGPKMIWQFGELGYDYSIFYGGDRTAPKPVRWDYWDNPHRQQVYRVYSAMANLRKHDAFRFGNFTHDLGGNGKRMWIAHSSMNVVIAANMGVQGTDITPGFQHTGTWYDYFSGESFNVSDPGGHTFYFAPGQYRVFTNQALPKPFYNVNITVSSANDQQPLQGATISLQGAGQQLSAANGQAAFTAFAGEATLSISKPGYHTHTQTLNINQDMNVEISLQVDATSFNEVQHESSQVKVFPNPAQGQLFIEAPAKGMIEVFNMQGRLLLSKEMQDQQITLDVSGLGKGLYLIRVSGPSFVEVSRIMLY